MDVKDACEQAYQNGYHDGIKSKLEYKSYLQKRCVALRNKCDELETECHQLQKERDAAVADLKKCYNCGYCKHYMNEEEYGDYSPECRKCGWYPWNDEDKVPYLWEWRGVRDEN